MNNHKSWSSDRAYYWRTSPTTYGFAYVYPDHSVHVGHDRDHSKKSLAHYFEWLEKKSGYRIIDDPATCDDLLSAILVAKSRGLYTTRYEGE